MAGPNCEEPLGAIILEESIQFESKVSQDKENEDQASHENPAWASEADTPPICNACINSCGHMHTMSKPMLESLGQCDFYG